MPDDIQAHFADTFSAAGNRRLKVAILLFDDVEVLDFAGPFEVFGVARYEGDLACDVKTVALESGEIVARNGLKVRPSCKAIDIGRVDVFVIPGGAGTRRELHNPAMLEFICRTSDAAMVTLSVCTGALLLGAAGRLVGQCATTHRDAMDELRELNCGAEIVPTARVVDNGRIVTSAGISAGIDAALHIIARIFGQISAENTAHYMQYDWNNRTVDLR